MLLQSRRRFKLNWRVSLFCLLFCTLFIFLGFWQLGKGEQKEQLIAEMAENQQSHPLSVSELKGDLAEFNGKLMRNEGRFQEIPAILLDNKVLKGQIGYEVIQPFQPAKSERWILVNRGFVAMTGRRSDPVNIPETGDASHIFGQIYLLPEDTYVIENHIEKLGENYRVQITDFNQAEKLLAVEFFPFVLRLDENHHAALPRHWPINVMKPEMHFGYSVQWFLMAFALLIMYLWFSFPKTEENEEDE